MMGEREDGLAVVDNLVDILEGTEQRRSVIVDKVMMVKLSLDPG
jgi:hypothetical protein